MSQVIKYETGLGDILDSSITRLDTFLADGAIEFIGSLWDPEVGGFYYSQSGRDYRGFLPSDDSTLQVLNFISSGAVQGLKGRLSDKLPDDIKKTIFDFAETSDSKGKAIKEKLGELPASAPAAKPKIKSAPPRKYASADELIAYLDDISIADDFATRLVAELSNIKSSGFTKEMFDYLDKSAFKENECYLSVSEIYKIGSVYNDEKREILNARKLLENVLSLITSNDIPESIIEIYNAWAALRTLLQNADIRGESEKSAVYSFVRSMSKSLIDKTLEKLSVFKKNDGGYSYYQGFAPDKLSGKRVALGVPEGDVNATFVVLHGVRGNIFSSLGLTVPPLLPEESFDVLIDMMRSAEPPEKRRIPIKFILRNLFRGLK